MKPNKTVKRTPLIQKLSCTLLASCLMFSSCKQTSSGDDFSGGKISPAPQATNIPVPTNTPVPEPTPFFTFLPTDSNPENTSLLDYISQEDMDTIFSYSYTPDRSPQLYARYRGQLENPERYYCIDLIQTDPALSDLLVNVKIFNTHYRSEACTMLQNLYYHTYASLAPEASENPFQLIDINNDGYTDFLLDLGLCGKAGMYSLCFIYDSEKTEYALLGNFLSANYLPERQLIYENIHMSMGEPDISNKYIISGTEAVLVEKISYLIDVSETYYTYEKWIDDEFVTILSNVSYEELSEQINLTEWHSYAYVPQKREN